MADALDAAARHVTQHPDFAGRFKHPVKFNGSEFVEQRLTAEEQLNEVSGLVAKKFHVFLERYGSLLPADELRALGALPAAESAEAQFWLERLLREPLAGSRREKQRRRRRWAWAKSEMARPDGFFSEDEMKRRDPQLFHRLVGKHMESGAQLSAPMQGSLSGYLMQQLERECQTSARDVAPKAGPPDAANDDKQDAAGDGVGAGGGSGEGLDLDDELSWGSDEEVEESTGDGKRRRLEQGFEADDAAVRRARFLKAMRDRFVNGREQGFNYSALDEDSELDDVVELGRDAEDKYFDDD